MQPPSKAKNVGRLALRAIGAIGAVAKFAYRVVRMLVVLLLKIVAFELESDAASRRHQRQRENDEIRRLRLAQLRRNSYKN